MTDGAENYSKEAREYMRKMTMAITSMMEATREFNSKVDFISDAPNETSRQMADIGEEIVSLGRKIIDFRKLLLRQEEGA